MPRDTMMKWDEARTSREADPTNPALIEAEYAAERAHFEAVRDGSSLRRRVLTVLIIFAVAASAWQIKDIIQETQQNTAEVAATTAQVNHLTNINRALVNSLQAAVVESCEVNGNTRAKVEREQLAEEIHEAEHPDPEAFKALVESGIPEIAILRSERKAIVKLERRLGRVHVVDCATQYQISPGSGKRRRGSDSSSP